MSFFNKMISKIEIGSATVETQLFNELFIPGELIRGEVRIQGGPLEQYIDSIYLNIKSTYEDQTDTKRGEDKIYKREAAVIMDFQISEPFTMNPDQIINFDLEFPLPSYTPVTIGGATTWIETGFNMKMAVEQKDKAYIHVQPHPLMDAVLGSAMDIGLEVYRVVCQSAPSLMNMKVPFIQKFALQPVEGHLKSRLNDISLIFRLSKSSLEVFMDVDRKLKDGSEETTNITDSASGEPMARLSISYNNLDSLTLMLNDMIEQHC